MLQLEELPTQSLTTLSNGSAKVLASMPIVFHSETSVLTCSSSAGTPLPYSSVTVSFAPFLMPVPQSEAPVPGLSQTSTPPVVAPPCLARSAFAFVGSYGYGFFVDAPPAIAVGVTGGKGLS